MRIFTLLVAIQFLFSPLSNAIAAQKIACPGFFDEKRFTLESQLSDITHTALEEFQAGKLWTEIHKSFKGFTSHAIERLILEIASEYKIPKMNYTYNVKVGNKKETFKSLEDFFTHYDITEDTKKFYHINDTGKVYIDGPSYSYWAIGRDIQSELELALLESLRLLDPQITDPVEIRNIIINIFDKNAKNWIKKYNKFLPNRFNYTQYWEKTPPYLKEARFIPIKKIIEEVIKSSGQENKQVVFDVLDKMYGEIKALQKNIDLNTINLIEDDLFQSSNRFQLYNSKFYEPSAVYISLSNVKKEGTYHYSLTVGDKRFDGFPNFSKPRFMISKNGKPKSIGNGMIFKINLPEEAIFKLDNFLFKKGNKIRQLSCLHSICKILDTIDLQIGDSSKPIRAKRIFDGLLEGDVTFRGEKLGKENIDYLATSEAAFDYILQRSETVDQEMKNKISHDIILSIVVVAFVSGVVAYGVYVKNSNDKTK
ncbi:MAG: hypothetical protein H6621_09845 [Halobacteriovoraceae bacterium]|nr:hypothetical protein [Halobacteriovoraceae bacterium]MCB9095359.1 hypothetical protein [Halobacteriovoraceae bacterium]